MEYLFVVDVQREFIKDAECKSYYNKCLKAIKDKKDTCCIIALIYRNKPNSNMVRLNRWDKMMEIKPLDFTPEYVITHDGYSPSRYIKFESEDVVHVFGFDTDACVLSTCFDLFNSGVNFDIWTDLCWSSGGKKMHECGLSIMNRQFGNAVTKYK